MELFKQLFLCILLNSWNGLCTPEISLLFLLGFWSRKNMPFSFMNVTKKKLWVCLMAVVFKLLQTFKCCWTTLLNWAQSRGQYSKKKLWDLWTRQLLDCFQIWNFLGKVNNGFRFNRGFEDVTCRNEGAKAHDNFCCSWQHCNCDVFWERKFLILKFGRRL